MFIYLYTIYRYLDWLYPVPNLVQLKSFNPNIYRDWKLYLTEFQTIPSKNYSSFQNLHSYREVWMLRYRKYMKNLQMYFFLIIQCHPI